MALKYWVAGYVPDDQDAIVCPNAGPEVDRYAASDCAKHFWVRNNGWEIGWPLEITISNGTVVKKFEVDVECVPQFYCVRECKEGGEG